ncbi:hypothetical protein WICPIJ_000164 [Wickerhamomyces pijperi]|uniref:Uncharacterized protein n=1 Tax=Wickerhamomyces pijperi TaxID=599730 RepID=A0A9P8QED3_WICPI|nr:hypothetical protein WICPIJ_000164 [Wickerhamomyces pijperi]
MVESCNLLLDDKVLDPQKRNLLGVGVQVFLLSTLPIKLGVDLRVFVLQFVHSFNNSGFPFNSFSFTAFDFLHSGIDLSLSLIGQPTGGEHDVSVRHGLGSDDVLSGTVTRRGDRDQFVPGEELLEWNPAVWRVDQSVNLLRR